MHEGASGSFINQIGAAQTLKRWEKFNSGLRDENVQRRLSVAQAEQDYDKQVKLLKDIERDIKTIVVLNNLDCSVSIQKTYGEDPNEPIRAFLQVRG